MAPPTGPDTRPLLFVECTNTFHSPVQTGIQRVVRNILRNAQAVADAHGYDIVPVVFVHGQFRAASLQRLLHDRIDAEHTTPMTPPRPPRTLREHVIGLLRPAYRGTRNAVATVLPFAPVRRFLFAHPVEFGLAWLVLQPWRLVRAAAFRLAPSLAVPRPIDAATLDDGFGVSLDSFEHNDGHVLLLLDASWGIPHWPAVDRFQAKGGRTLGVIYDLVPITHVETSVRSLHKEYVASVYEHARVSGRFLTISRTVASELDTYLGTLSPALPPWRIDSFYLGSELDFIDPDRIPRPKIQALFDTPDHVFIVVGSIEPRKNHGFILDAFDRFWREGGKARLVIIGRFGWKNEDVVERITGHALFDERMFLVRDMDDSELDYAYRQASALVIASETEGFGLPVVEAFQRGLRVICSDIAVFREIADGRAIFFSLATPDNLTRTVAAFCAENDAALRTERHPQAWLTWRESTEQLLKVVLE